MKSIITVINLIILSLLFSCSTSKTLRYTKKPDNIVTTESLKDFLENNKNPKVVLRVSNASFTVTENENNDYLYNAIENELLANGFVVRDRQLFNQIIANNDNTIDYEVLKNKSDTDLIIELTRLDPSILYTTNKYYDKNDKEKVDSYKEYKRYGASIEFKVVLINSNEFAGVYKFNYTPCTEGCVISKSLKQQAKERKNRYKEGEKPYEGVEMDDLEVFIKNATSKLVSEMRK